MEDSGGRLLRYQLSHQEIAELVGATRPRITEHLARLEREGLIARRGRRFVVNVDTIEKAILPKEARF
jgi:DNA-binding GntR family transcriptional regulator